MDKLADMVIIFYRESKKRKFCDNKLWCTMLCDPFSTSWVWAWEQILKSHTWAELMGFPVAQMVKNPSAMQEIWVWSLGQEDPLEKGMTIHLSILAWRIPWPEELGRPMRPMRWQRVRHNWVTNTFFLSWSDPECWIGFG